MSRYLPGDLTPPNDTTATLACGLWHCNITWGSLSRQPALALLARTQQFSSTIVVCLSYITSLLDQAHEHLICQQTQPLRRCMQLMLQAAAGPASSCGKSSTAPDAAGLSWASNILWTRQHCIVVRKPLPHTSTRLTSPPAVGGTTLDNEVRHFKLSLCHHCVLLATIYVAAAQSGNMHASQQYMAGQIQVMAGTYCIACQQDTA
jgi:hypothetical protein